MKELVNLCIHKQVLAKLNTLAKQNIWNILSKPIQQWCYKKLQLLHENHEKIFVHISDRKKVSSMDGMEQEPVFSHETIHNIDDLSLLLVQAGVARDDAETWLSQLQSGELWTSVADPDSNPDPDPPDPHVFGPPSGSISQRYGSGSGSFYHQAKIVRKTVDPTALWLLFDFLSLKK